MEDQAYSPMAPIGCLTEVIEGESLILLDNVADKPKCSP